MREERKLRNEDEKKGDKKEVIQDRRLGKEGRQKRRRGGES